MILIPYKNYYKKFPTVAQAKENARTEMLDEAELRLWKAIQRDESWAIAFCLKTIGRSRGYGERLDLNVSIQAAAAKVAQEFGLTPEAVLAEAKCFSWRSTTMAATPARECGTAHPGRVPAAAAPPASGAGLAVHGRHQQRTGGRQAPAEARTMGAPRSGGRRRPGAALKDARTWEARHGT